MQILGHFEIFDQENKENLIYNNCLLQTPMKRAFLFYSSRMPSYSYHMTINKYHNCLFWKQEPMEPILILIKTAKNLQKRHWNYISLI